MSRIVPLPGFYSSLIQDIETLGWNRFVYLHFVQNAKDLLLMFAW